jgi:hypothetical protein
MKTNLMIATVALLSALSAPVLAQDADSPIVGAWQMTSLEIASADGAYSSIPYSGMVMSTAEEKPATGRRKSLPPRGIGNRCRDGGWRALARALPG